MILDGTFIHNFLRLRSSPYFHFFVSLPAALWLLEAISLISSSPNYQFTTDSYLGVGSDNYFTDCPVIRKENSIVKAASIF